MSPTLILQSDLDFYDIPKAENNSLEKSVILLQVPAVGIIEFLASEYLLAVLD